jgi:hypothetical protein
MTRSRLSLPASVALAVLLAFAATTQAAPIYSQMAPSPNAEFFADSHDGGLLTADDFVLGSADTIRSVSWQGANGPAGPFQADAFRILFYADSGGTPGTLLGAFNVGAAFRVSTGTTFGDFGDALYTYEANLGGAGFAAAGGTRYWIAIINDAIDPVATWSWAGTFVGTAAASFDNGASWVGQPDAATNFALDSSTVPEPATLSLLALGLIGLASARKRLG